MKTIYLTLILSFLFLNNCKDEPDSNERGQNLLNFYLLSQPPFLRPNYCGQPQLMLEEGVTYNITLEPGKRYWFDYAVRSQAISSKRYRLTIDKNSNTELVYVVQNCTQSFTPDPSIPKIKNASQIVYEDESLSYTNNAGFHSDLRFFLEVKEGDYNISLIFEQF